MYQRVAARKRIADRYLQATVGEIPLGKTVEVGTVRIHRYRGMLEITDLTNAGRRGKKVETASVTPDRVMKDMDEEEFMARLTVLISHRDSYPKVMATLKDYMTDYPEDLRIHLSQARGVDVKPAGMTEIRIKGRFVSISTDGMSFTVKDLTDMNNEPTLIDKGKKGNLAFYTWVRDNLSKVNSMTFKDVENALQSLGVASHFYLAMD